MSVAIVGPPSVVRGSKVDIVGLRVLAGRMLRALDLADSELSVALVDDAEIKALNAQWRDKDRATDVLSFSLVEGDFADHRAGLLGDVVISVETAAEQAADEHRSLDEVVTKLLIHGVLHLIGHDHEADDEAAKMRGEERRLWKAIGC